MYSVSAALPIVHAILERRYGPLNFVSARGLMKGQRLECMENGRRIRVTIKVSTGGRISFARKDGGWRGLSDADRVVVIGPTSLDGDDMVVSMYDRDTLVTSFDAADAAQRVAGMSEEVPVWLAPFHEEGRGARGIGDGFQAAALWAEVPDGDDAEALAETSASDTLADALNALIRAAAANLPGSKVEVRIVLQ